MSNDIEANMIDVVVCDSCDEKIASNQIEVKDIEYKDGRQKRSWYCLHCNHEHLIIIMSKQTRRLMKENKKDSIKISNMNKQSDILDDDGKLDEVKLNEHMKQVDKVTERISKREDRIDELSKGLIEEYKEEYKEEIEK